jgi:hypothetical protein
VDFHPVGADDVLADDAKRRTARRKLEWLGIGDRCLTCKPLIICESLAQPARYWPTRDSVPVFVEGQHTHVHLIAGLEKRPVVVDPTLAERKRTIACTRWTPMGQPRSGGPCKRPDSAGVPAPSTPVPLVCSDSTDQGIPDATPFLTLRHDKSMAELLEHPGYWEIELFLHEALDGIKSSAAEEVCDKQDTGAWKGYIEVRKE